METKKIRRALAPVFRRNSGEQHGDKGQVIAVTFKMPFDKMDLVDPVTWQREVTIHKSNSHKGWWDFLLSLEE